MLVPLTALSQALLFKNQSVHILLTSAIPDPFTMSPNGTEQSF